MRGIISKLALDLSFQFSFYAAPINNVVLYIILKHIF